MRRETSDNFRKKSKEASVFDYLAEKKKKYLFGSHLIKAIYDSVE